MMCYDISQRYTYTYNISCQISNEFSCIWIPASGSAACPPRPVASGAWSRGASSAGWNYPWGSVPAVRAPAVIFSRSTTRGVYPPEVARLPSVWPFSPAEWWGNDCKIHPVRYCRTWRMCTIREFQREITLALEL